MDLQTELNIARSLYKLSKISQLVFQLFYIIYLSVYISEDLIYILIGNILILLFVLSSWYVMSVYYEALFREDGHYLEYRFVLIGEGLIVLVATILYTFVINYVYSQYKSKEPYLADYEDLLKLNANEINREPRHLNSETVDEQIETATKYLVDKALNSRNELISIMNINENSSNLIDATQNGKVPMFKTEDLYFKYFSFLGLTCLYSIFIHLDVVCSLGWIESVKSRIRKARITNYELEQLFAQALEMQEINNAAVGVD